MEKHRPVPRVREVAVRLARLLTLVLLLILPGCLVPAERGGGPSLTVSSAAFAPDGVIPEMYTCEGANISPPLSWSAPPRETGSIAILVTDPDAPGGTFIHWVAFNMQPETREIPAGVPGMTSLPAGAVQGRNDMDRPGYGGPCPPRGNPHHYHFTVYALDSTITPAGIRDGRMLLKAMEGHILAWGEIVGVYQRT